MTPNRLKSALFKGLGRNVIVLGFVSLFTDISSEMLYPIIPIFLTSVLMAPMAVLGVIEGCAEATASLLKYFSGYWSDKIKSHVPFVVSGYSISAVSKPLLILAATWHWVLAARIIDRLGKGIRTSPRDALIAASCDANSRGKAYGLHRAMDSIGAVIGPVIAIAFLWLFTRSGAGSDPKRAYQLLFLCAFVPAMLGVACFFFLQNTGPVVAKKKSGDGHPGLRGLSPELRRLLVIVALFSLGNSSDVFLLLGAKKTGFSTTGVLWIYVLYNFINAAAAGPLGSLSDRLGRRKVMTGGFIIFALVYAGFAVCNSQISIPVPILEPPYLYWYIFRPSRFWILLLFAIYGLYAAANEGIAKAYVADLSTSENRGTAMGAYQIVIGFMALLASLVAGFLWDYVNPAATFLYGAICALGAAILFFILLRGRKTQEKIQA